MRYLIIDNNVIVNIVAATDEYAQRKGWPTAPDGVAVGWYRSGPGQPWTAPAMPPPEAQEVPEQVLRWQAVRALRLHDDPNAPGRSCLDTVNALRDAIPDENLRADVDDALLHVMTWRRASPTLAKMATAAGWLPEFVDQLFIAAHDYDL